MPIRSGFFNSVNGDRRYLAHNFAEYFASFIANGVFPNPSTGLQVYEKSNMTVTVKPGRGWINGYFIVNESDYDLTLATADGVLNRIDRLVLRLDYGNREISIAVKQGTFASSPVAPTLKRDADAYEMAIADIYVGKGVTVISQANITDLRLNTNVCGIVHGTVDQVDTTTIFNQYQAWFNETTAGTETEINDWQVQMEQEFNTWFQSIQDILSGDVAANLASRISTLEETVAAHQADEEKHITPAERTSWNGKLNASADIAKFKKGSSSYTDNDTSQTFTDAFCTINSLVTIVITSATKPQGVWSVDSANGSFTITSTVAESADITFDYFIQKAVG